MTTVTSIYATHDSAEPPTFSLPVVLQGPSKCIYVCTASSSIWTLLTRPCISSFDLRLFLFFGPLSLPPFVLVTRHHIFSLMSDTF